MEPCIRENGTEHIFPELARKTSPSLVRTLRMALREYHYACHWKCGRKLIITLVCHSHMMTPCRKVANLEWKKER